LVSKKLSGYSDETAFTGTLDVKFISSFSRDGHVWD
jgi:hypothetical protein